MDHDLFFDTFVPARDEAQLAEVRRLLDACGLDLDKGVQVFLTCRRDGALVACAGLEDGVVKCVAIDGSMRGENLSLKLLEEMAHLALERGHAHLFLYTKPEQRERFEGCGFHTLATVPGHACLMENTPVGLSGACARLAKLRQPGARIGGIVLNANPFTLGHRHLVTRAAEACDWLHVFVLSEDASAIAYGDRLELVRAGTADLPRLTVHPGSRYMISKATFPSYFLKDQGLVETCSTAIDLLIFREHLAPALGITHRYVGTEPFCPLTRRYNDDMRRWLEAPELSPAAPIQVVEIPRLAAGGTAISASEVRRLLKAGDFTRMAGLVPPATLDLMRAKYAGKL